MDAIDAHVRRLPPLDDRWVARPHEPAELAEALLEGGVAGTATHPLDNVRGNALMLLEGDPDKLFGFDRGPHRRARPRRRPRHRRSRSRSADRSRCAIRTGRDPSQNRSSRRCAALGDRLAEACRRGETVIIATGHPVGLCAPLPCARRPRSPSEAPRCSTPADGARWRDPRLPPRLDDRPLGRGGHAHGRP